MRKYLGLFFICALFLATLASLPSVDHLESSIFFYLEHLPPIYYVCVLASIIIALRDKQELTRVISVCVLALLIIWTPSVMYVQPWHLDAYPFVAEAVHIERNAHLGDLHYLSGSPALGLTFGAFMLITGVTPLTLLKIFPGFLALLFVALVYLMADKLKIGKKTAIIAPLLFISVMWPDVFHFSRFSFSLLYYFTSLFLLFYLIFKKFDRRILALLFIQIIPLVISHPATPLFFMYNLVAIAVLAFASRKFQSKETKLICITLAVVSIIWLLWNMIGTTPGVIYTLKDISQNVVNSLIQSPTTVSGVSRILVGYNTVYREIINVRLVLMLAIYLCAFLIPIIMYKRLKSQKVLFILTAWAWSNMSVAIPLLYAGLPYFQKPVFFAMASWGPLALLLFKTKSRVWIRKAKYIFLVAFIISSALLIPLYKYAPVTLEYPPSKELTSKSFLDLYGSTSIGFIYFEDPAYYYSYILYNQSDLAVLHYGVLSIYNFGEGLNYSIVAENSLWITSRLLARDAFWAYDPSMHEIVENVTVTLPETTHNKVYDSGYPESILVPRNVD
jgi:hypothetical protein